MKPLVIAALCAAPVIPLATTSTAVTAQVAAASVHADPFGFPVPSEGLLIQSSEEDPLSMKQVLDTYAQVTGQTLLYTQETASFLSSSSLNFSGPLEVPAERVQTTVESLMAVHDFVMIPLTDSAPRLIQIVSMQTAARNTVRKNAFHVDAEHLDMAAEHPAVICSTVVDLPHTDVRQLSNSMRTMISDSNTQQMVPASSHAMVLVAPGNQIADMARMLKTVDEATATWFEEFEGSDE